MFISFGLGATVSCNMARHTLRSVCSGWNGPKLLLHGKQLCLFIYLMYQSVYVTFTEENWSQGPHQSLCAGQWPGPGSEEHVWLDPMQLTTYHLQRTDKSPIQVTYTDWTHASCIKCDPEPHALTNPWNETFTMRVTHLTWSEVPHHTRMRRAQPWMEPELKPC